MLNTLHFFTDSEPILSCHNTVVMPCWGLHTFRVQKTSRLDFKFSVLSPRTWLELSLQYMFLFCCQNHGWNSPSTCGSGDRSDCDALSDREMIKVKSSWTVSGSKRCFESLFNCFSPPHIELWAATEYKGRSPGVSIWRFLFWHRARVWSLKQWSCVSCESGASLASVSTC